MSEIRLTQTIDVSPQQVFRELTGATLLPLWLCNTAQAQPVVDGPIFLGWNSGYYAAGHYTLIDEGAAVSFLWRGRGEPGDTHVAITLTPTNGGTRLDLVHDQFGMGDIWALAHNECARGWESGLENLKVLLEDGVDLRIMRRPILGVSSARPVTEPVAGFRIDAPVAGLGAQAAGLQEGDILTVIDGISLADPGGYRRVMQRHVPGDVVSLVYVRDGAERQCDLTLSSQPQADVPTSVGELAEQLAEVNEQVIAELYALLADVTPAEAHHHPAPDEWNVLQVLAHLIYSEHWVHEALILARTDQPAPGFQNDNAHLAAIAHACGDSVVALLAEYRRQMTITEQMTATLPTDFVADRPNFRNHAQTVLVAWPLHTCGHHAQITAAVADARALVDR